MFDLTALFELIFSIITLIFGVGNNGWLTGLLG